MVFKSTLRKGKGIIKNELLVQKHKYFYLENLNISKVLFVENFLQSYILTTKIKYKVNQCNGVMFVYFMYFQILSNHYDYIQRNEHENLCNDKPK
jgi:hypothetical protein